MAARSKAGTSTVDTTSAAATRPTASATGTVSVLSTGRAASSVSRSASSKGSSCLNRSGRIARLLCQLAGEVAQLREDQSSHREADGLLRAGQDEDRGALRDAGRGS